MKEEIPESYFGVVRTIDWRKLPDPDTSLEDEELPITPRCIVDILGFDPKEFSVNE